MKATGIVRQMDDLGRIVISKKNRRALRIREGDFTNSIETVGAFQLRYAGSVKKNDVERHRKTVA